MDHYVLKGANLSNELEYRKEAILLTGYAILSSISVLALSELAVMEKFLFTLQSMLRLEERILVYDRINSA